MIPVSNPKAQYLAHKEEIDAALARVLERGQYILGPEVEAFEHEFAHFIGVSHAVGVASGTDAIFLALRSLGIGPGDEVITVAHTATATIAAIVGTGATPVFIDIDSTTYTMDSVAAERAITPRTKAILPVHLYGHPANLCSLQKIADAAGISLIEDAAQAHGAMDAGQRVGSWGRLGCFSFYPTKNLGAIGDGGIVVTNDDELAVELRALREYGWKERYVSSVHGHNSRLDALQAAVLSVKLKYLEVDNERRRALARVYAECFAGTGVTPPTERTGATHVYHLYVVRVRQRDALMAHLAVHGIAAAIHYPTPVHRQSAYARYAPVQPLAVTDDAAEKILSLPIYPELTVDDVRAVAEAIRSFPLVE